MDIDTYHSEGFIDLSDAYRDDNESGTYDKGEPYFNTASNSEFICLDESTDATCGDNKFIRRISIYSAVLLGDL